MSSVEPDGTPPPGPSPLAAPATEATDLLDNPRAGGRALRGSSLRTGGYVVSILLSLLAAPLLIRHLGNVGYGRYMVVVALVAVIAGLTEGGLNATAVRVYTTTSGAERRQQLANALGVRVIVTSIGACVAVGFAAAAGYGTALVIGTALASVGMLLQLVQGLYAVTLESTLSLGWLSLTELVRQVVNVALLVGLILAGAGVVLLLAVAIPASATSLLLTAWLVRGRIPLRPTFSKRAEWWPLVRQAIPWAAVAAANIVYFRLAIILMSLLASSAQTGYFATSMRVIEVLVGVPAVAVTAVYPILTRTVHGDTNRFSYATQRLFELALIAGVWMALCLEIGAGFIVHILADKQAEPAIEVLRIQGPAVIATFVGVACGFPLLTLGRYRAAIVANVAALLISGGLTAALAEPLGARGAAIAALCGEFAMATITLLSLRRAARDVPLSVANTPIIAVAGLVATAVGLLVPIQPMLAATLGSAVFFLVLAVTGRFPPEARELLSGRLTFAHR